MLHPIESATRAECGWLAPAEAIDALTTTRAVVPAPRTSEIRALPSTIIWVAHARRGGRGVRGGGRGDGGSRRSGLFSVRSARATARAAVETARPRHVLQPAIWDGGTLILVDRECFLAAHPPLRRHTFEELRIWVSFVWDIRVGIEVTGGEAVSVYLWCESTCVYALLRACAVLRTIDQARYHTTSQ